jgi:pyrimidine operon attenuation protein/uracil phosphoribosyltransferase
MTRRIAGNRDITKLVAKLAQAINKADRNTKDLALVGIKRRGVPLAERIAARMNRNRRSKIPVGTIDITLYRDDLQMVAETPIVRGTEIDFDINGRTLVLVDDVLFSGRTARAALSELLDFGRPRAIRLAVLLDRGHRELPIQADYVGRVLKTRPKDIVDIYLMETDSREGIYLTRQ